MSLAPPEAAGPLRRERLRTARLYFVCDAPPARRGPRAAAAGGADRRRRHRPAAREGRCRAARSSSRRSTFRRLCDTYSALFIVNDDPELARACDADGVHVGQDDMPVAEARELLGPEAIIGLSTHSEEQIAAAAEAPVDYISVGPVWETPTKEGRPGVGLELVAHAAGTRPIPSSRSAASTRRTPPRWSRPARAGSASCGRSATPRSRPRRPKRCAAPWARSARRRRVAERRKRKERDPRAATARRPRADGARLRPGRGAQPGGARGAASRWPRASGRWW